MGAPLQQLCCINAELISLQARYEVAVDGRTHSHMLLESRLLEAQINALEEERETLIRRHWPTGGDPTGARIK